jgi:hypothetical protein
MWIRDVDIPEPLIEAHRVGKLVIFVGAGASRGEPSNLPDFKTLTAGIAADANVVVEDGELEQTDVFLGLLKDHHNVDVHARVATRVGAPTSQPNRLHQSIVALGAAETPLRIVTTNYDLHLSTVLTRQGLSVAEYMAPALPMGDDFSGLVYLHGSLRQDPRALVVTDVDFGRAYLRDAWAARFLERMFATYTVLFVGYSHGDMVMRYLARGLGSSSLRYAFTDHPESADWRRLRITPIGYPNADGSHNALAAAVDGWAGWSSMGLLDHRQRLAQLVSGAPSQVPEEASYIEALIADGEKVRFFAEHAKGGEWLQWAAAQPEFKRLFDPSAATTDCTGTLAYWFAEHCVMNEDLTAQALSVVQEAGGRLGPTVWSAIGQTLHRRKDPRPAWLGPWLVLLVQNAPEVTHDWLEYALVASRWPEDRVAAVMLFDYLAEPFMALQPTFGFDARPRLDVGLRGSHHWLADAWRQLFAPNLETVAPELLIIVDRHLRRANQLLQIGGISNPGWDPLSFSRSAIDPHRQDNLSQPFDVLIDIARDCLEALLARGDDRGLGYIHSWATSGVPLLRRLAVHGWVQRDDVSATVKLTWLRDQGWLFDHQLRHEVFRLIETTLADADVAISDAIVADAVAGPEDAGEYREYEAFSMLTWMAHHAPSLQSATDALIQIRAEHPDFQEPHHPDLLFAWLDPETVPHQPPMTVESLHQLIESDVGDAIVELRSYENAVPPFDRPTWNDAITVLAETVRRWPVDGFAVLDAAGGDHLDLMRAVIRGWSKATVEDDTAELILLRLMTVDLAAMSDDVAKLLSEGGQGESTPTEWHRMGSSRHLAVRVWEAIDPGGPAAERMNWLSQAVNHPAGWLAEYWLHAISADWRSAGETWSGLPAATREQLDLLLTGEDQRTAMAEVILASQVHFLFSADSGWCEENVLPLLDWADPARARRTWDGFLAWGRWTDRILRAGLLTQYLATTRHIGEFSDEAGRQLCRHLAAIAVYSEIDPIAYGWASTFTTTVDTSVRAEWIDQVTWFLGQMPPDAVEHQWQRWMHQYWRDRIASIPTQLTIEEASAMTQWVPYLTNSMTDAAITAMEHPARLRGHSMLLAELTNDRIDRAPAELATLIAHLLRGTNPPFWDCHHLRDVIRMLRDQGNQIDVTPILEQAVRLNCGDAPTW